MMRYLSICSGIEAASVAWHPLGWRPAAFAEIDTFPSAVLAHRFPDVPNLGDITKFKDWPDADVDVLVGGTPCQSFSVAGLRKGLDDPRGNLMLTFGAIAARYRPRWLVWENVPGVLSSHGGRDFGSFLGMLGQLGYGFAYRVLDAQYVRVDGYGRAVPQRRQRVFVVGCLGDWRRAAAVLLERESLRGDPAPGRSAREAVAGSITASAGRRGGVNEGERSSLIAGTLQASADASDDGTGRGTPLICMAHGQGGAEIRQDGGTPTLTCNHEAPIVAAATLLSGGHSNNPLDEAVAFDSRQDCVSSDATFGALGASSPQAQAVAFPWCVRRLTPLECERLQGFPDGWTLVPYRGGVAKDGPRYKAIGNSMAVNCMRWIGRRIALAESIKVPT